MSEEGIHPGVIINELHEEFVQHVESGSSRMKQLSIITIVVTFLLGASYFSQLLLPFVSNTRVVQVNLLDPTLILVQIFLLILVAVWLYIGVVDYLFATRLSRRIKEARAKEMEMEKGIAG